MNKEQAFTILQSIPWNSLRYSKGGERIGLSARQLQAVTTAMVNLKAETQGSELSIVAKATSYIQDSGYLIRFGVSAHVRDKVVSDLKADQILPGLPLDSKIGCETDSKYFRLYIGPRDWQWDRKTGEMIGCGTMIG